jgi:hypothetical protein
LILGPRLGVESYPESYGGSFLLPSTLYSIFDLTY